MLEYLLKDPCMDSLTDRFVHSELQGWDQCLKNARDTQGEIELSGFRARVRGQLSFKHKC